MKYFELECAETLKSIIELFPDVTPNFQTDMNTIYLDTIRTWMVRNTFFNFVQKKKKKQNYNYNINNN